MSETKDEVMELEQELLKWARSPSDLRSALRMLSDSLRPILTERDTLRRSAEELQAKLLDRAMAGVERAEKAEAERDRLRAALASYVVPITGDPGQAPEPWYSIRARAALSESPTAASEVVA